MTGYVGYVGYAVYGWIVGRQMFRTKCTCYTSISDETLAAKHRMASVG